MAIPSRQIGWGTEENLLWEISKQLEALTGVISKIGQITTTTTTTSAVQNTIFRVSSMAETVCFQSPTLSLYYIAPLAEGSMLYTDQALTQQYTEYSYIVDPAVGTVYGIFNGVASFQFNCI